MVRDDERSSLARTGQEHVIGRISLTTDENVLGGFLGGRDFLGGIG